MERVILSGLVLRQRRDICEAEKAIEMLKEEALETLNVNQISFTALKLTLFFFPHIILSWAPIPITVKHEHIHDMICDGEFWLRSSSQQDSYLNSPLKYSCLA